MKIKFLLAAVPALALASCSQDEMIVENEMDNNAINFSAYVGNSSRADMTTTFNNLTKFKLWATKTRNCETATNYTSILSDVEAVKNPTTNTWSYSPLKYWVKENAYSFTGIGSMTGNASKDYTFELPTSIAAGTYMTHYLGKLTFDNSTTKANGLEDLVWANTKVPTVTTLPGTVKMNFKHILSKVNLRFVNTRNIDDENSIEIRNARIISASTGELDLTNIETSTASTDFTWTPSVLQAKAGDDVNAAVPAFSCPFTFATSTPASAIVAKNSVVESEARFIIPNQQTITVSFDVYTSVTGTDFVNITREINFHSIATSEAFKDVYLKPGYSYTLVAYISNDLDNLGQINITVESVNEFKDAVVNPFLFDINFGSQPTYKYYEDTELADMETKTLTVEDVVLNKYGELVYYGQNPKTFVPSNYTYEWSMDSSNGAIAFADGSYSKQYAKGTVTNVSQLAVDIKFVGERKKHADVPVTMTIRDEEGNIIVQESIPVHFVLLSTTTGGSQDGDDNDG